MVQQANLQSLVVRRPSKPYYAVLLLRLDDAAAARAFLKTVLPRIAPGDSLDAAGTPLLNLFLSWRAIAAFVDGNSQLDPLIGRRQFEPFFTDPLQAPDSLAMADQLGFTGPSAPSNWWEGFATKDIDLVVYAGCDDDAQREDLLDELRRDAEGLTELTLSAFGGKAVTGNLPPGGRLHFGYRDGITSPAVDWDDAGDPAKVNLREFLLGYPTDDYPTTPYPAGPWRNFARDGSFACLTWIHQDVATFEAFLAEHAPTLQPKLPGVDAKEWLAAQLMGRWRDGTPLARYPDTPPAAADPDNAFGYADDAEGNRCPLDAHIRIAYSRDQPLSFANTLRFPKGPPRLIRRGFSYGAPLASAVDDGQDRGLFGIFLCARINEQFYTVLRWMQQTEFSNVFDCCAPGRAGQDRLTGSRLPGGANRTPDSRITVNAGDASIALSLKAFIRYRGVSVFFVPSLTALHTIVAA